MGTRFCIIVGLGNNMTSKATAIAHPNIAFVKYWGRLDDKLRLPMNNSISMNLDPLSTITTVEFSDVYKKDDIQVLDSQTKKSDTSRVTAHLELIRKLMKIVTKARVVSKNTFPQSSGVGSSASGFAALTLAATKAIGLDCSEKELSILARQGSGSASRSVPTGFVEWIAAASSNESFAYTIAPYNHWDIRDIIAIIETSPKRVSSTKGHLQINTSAFYNARLAKLHQTLAEVRTAILEKNFRMFGEAIEAEAISLHVVSMTSKPAIFYWAPATLRLIQAIQNWRLGGLEVYFTIDAGPNVHLICEAKNEQKVKQMIAVLDGVREVLVAQPGEGVKLSENHLF